MKKVDLKAKPFYLSEEDVNWVEETIKGMTIEEKIGQLFVIMDKSPDGGRTASELIKKYKPGGARYMGGNASQVYDQIKLYKEASKLPLLVACNCEAGGDGAAQGGTYIAAQAAAGAVSDDKVAYNLGYVSGRESAAIGCNWAFGPVSDIFLNWRNTIINSRSYGDDPDKVLEYSKAYIRGLEESKMSACTKHFPGDGVEERDQHLLMGVNDQSIEEWDKTFGKVYRGLIEEGIKSMMVGHIALPAYSRKFKPNITDAEIMPATLAPEILQNLLREELNFNGLLVTDASHMLGMTSAMPRNKQVPTAIAAGCDMFLFFHHAEEDFKYMMDGYKEGIITEERLEDALRRILGLKASMNLHKDLLEGNLMPDKEGLRILGCEEHKKMAEDAAKRSITLVKDTENNLPITPETHKRLKVYYVTNPQPMDMIFGNNGTKAAIKEELEAAGFEVDMHENYHDLSAKEGHTYQSMMKSTFSDSVEKLKENYDAVLMFVEMKGYCQENVVRVQWSIGHGSEIPWYVRELPTICISLSQTTNLFDLPMMKTYINAYGSTRTVIRETVKRIKGEEEFQGKHNETVFCERWETRL
ncbi:glycoside hydrolase family 3 protein [Clostridium sp. LP20]|uniref:glycoside hydrolase family 3 protein n=1 Tax=Clostridium sp. LP20 TaxID=3418665 RepID=UPI003EE69700